MNPTAAVSKQFLIEIGSPTPGQTITAGQLLVDGIAVETGGDADGPHVVVQVTIQIGGSPPIDAVLGPPPQPETGAVGFSATVDIPGDGQFRITAKAIDDAGKSVSTTLTIVVDGGAVQPIWPGSPWTNYDDTQSITPAFVCAPRSVDDLVTIVLRAEAGGKKVHALGSAYSYSDCAMTTDYMVYTNGLQRPIQTVQSAVTGPTPPLVYHVEAGITIRQLYQNLDALGYALETMGGSSGQSIAGAISTGTHGGDCWIGPLADSVLAIHLVGAGGTQYWIEPTAAITDKNLLRQHVVPNIDVDNIIYDDATFNACLVSLGCMGIIYAVVLRVRPKYDLIETTVASTWQVFAALAQGFLVQGFVTDRSNRFLQVAIDPYRDGSNNNCLITTRTEAPPTTAGTRPGPSTGAIVSAIVTLLQNSNIGVVGDVAKLIANGLLDIPNEPISEDQKIAKIVQLVLSQTPDAWPFLAQSYWTIMPLQWPVASFRGLSFSVMDTTYGATPAGSSPSYSIELFFPVDAGGKLGFVDFVNAALEVINSNTSSYLVGYVSLRFTGATRATLGMQQWNQTCAVEISAVQGVQGIEQMLTDILNLVYRYGGLPHWGQLIDRGVQGNVTLYPRFAEWRAAYAKLSKNFTARTFENAMSIRWELTTPEELQLAGTTADGAIWHTIRHVDGSWQGFGNVKGQAGDVGTFTAITTAAVAGEMQLAGVTSDGQVWHTIRDSAGSWQGFGNVKRQTGDPGSFTAVASAGVAGELQLAGITTSGDVWHTIRHADGSWASFGDVKGQAGNPGTAVAVAVAGVAGELQLSCATQDGGLWHTIRHADGSWAPFGDVKGQAGQVGTLDAVAMADTMST